MSYSGQTSDTEIAPFAQEDQADIVGGMASGAAVAVSGARPGAGSALLQGALDLALAVLPAQILTPC